MAYKYIKPVSSPISQTFGVNDPRIFDYRTVGQRGHNGIDYASPYGTPVKAVADGVIAFEGWGQNHGWAGRVAGIYCLIRHEDNYSGYAHLSRTVVNRGQRVRKGQIIGFTGNTGAVTGAHLHFEMFPLRVNIANGYYGRIDPRPLFRLREAKRATAVRPANVRKAPNLSAPLSGSKRLEKGQSFPYVAVVKGTTVAGNNKWLKSSAGNYVWSGNCKY